MLFKIKFKNQESEIYANSLMESVEIINRHIKNQSILSFPINMNIVANWSSRSKSPKYNFVEIKKIGKKKIFKKQF